MSRNDSYGNPNEPLGRMKLTNYIPLEPMDAEIDFLAMLGVGYAYSWTDDLPAKIDKIERLIERLDKRGIKLHHLCDGSVAKDDNVILGLERRDEIIGKFIRALEVQGKFGLGAAVFTWEADKMQSSGNVVVRGGAGSRACDAAVMEKFPLSHGRIYEKDELWENFRYFVKAVIPVAERTGVHLALHPNDPPMPMIGGIASLITSYEDYRKAFEIADSKMMGMEFCCGCWLEGGERFGDIPSAFKEFVKEGRVLITHFRNISGPLPYFEERFLDDGYGDMYSLIHTFYEADYDGAIILDHTPSMIPASFPGGEDAKDITPPQADTISQPGYQQAVAFATGYIKALMNAASHDVFALP